MLTLVIFLLAVYGFANALAVLKIGCYFFGDPDDEILLKDGKKLCWKVIVERDQDLEVEDHSGEKTTIAKTAVSKIRKRKGLGRIPYVGDLFYCPACLSFWIGMAASAWVLSPAAAICPVPWKAIMLDGFMACGVSWLFHLAAMKMAQGVEEA